MDLSGSGQVSVMGFCEHNNEFLDSMKGVRLCTTVSWAVKFSVSNSYVTPQYQW